MCSYLVQGTESFFFPTLLVNGGLLNNVQQPSKVVLKSLNWTHLANEWHRCLRLISVMQRTLRHNTIHEFNRQTKAFTLTTLNHLERSVMPTGAPGIHLSFPYFLRAPSKIYPTTKIHQVLRFVGKDQNYFGFNRKTDV